MKLFELSTELGSIFFYAEDLAGVQQMLEFSEDDLDLPNSDCTIKEVTERKIIIEAGYHE